VLPYDVALRFDVDDNYESTGTLLANWGYDTMALMDILMSVIRGPGHPDKSMYKRIGTKNAGYDHREGHDTTTRSSYECVVPSASTNLLVNAIRNKAELQAFSAVSHSSNLYRLGGDEYPVSWRLSTCAVFVTHIYARIKRREEMGTCHPAQTWGRECFLGTRSNREMTSQLLYSQTEVIGKRLFPAASKCVIGREDALGFPASIDN